MILLDNLNFDSIFGGNIALPQNIEQVFENVSLEYYDTKSEKIFIRPVDFREPNGLDINTL